MFILLKATKTNIPTTKNEQKATKTNERLKMFLERSMEK
jgi:hypothetical protein